jgi:hypothetical protein
MTRLTIRQRRNRRRRRPPPTIHWSHVVGFLAGISPLIVSLISSHE